MQDLTRLRLETVAAQVVVFLLHLAEARQYPIHVTGPGRIRHGVLQLLELVMQVAEPAAASNRLVQHGTAGHLLDILAEVTDRQLPWHRHVAVVGRFLTNDHPEQRRLARTVGPDQADLLARIQLEGDLDEEDLLAVLLADT